MGSEMCIRDRDGIDIRDIKQHDLREKLGYVPQKGVLFSGNIASNIMFGNQDGTEAEMKEAAEIAQATEFIETKPEGYESRSLRAVPMYPVVRSRDFRLQERLQSIHRYLFLMTVFRLLTIRRM